MPEGATRNIHRKIKICFIKMMSIYKGNGHIFDNLWSLCILLFQVRELLSITDGNMTYSSESFHHLVESWPSDVPRSTVPQTEEQRSKEQTAPPRTPLARPLLFTLVYSLTIGYGPQSNGSILKVSSCLSAQYIQQQVSKCQMWHFIYSWVT